MSSPAQMKRFLTDKLKNINLSCDIGLCIRGQKTMRGIGFMRAAAMKLTKISDAHTLDAISLHKQRLHSLFHNIRILTEIIGGLTVQIHHQASSIYGATDAYTICGAPYPPR